MNNTQDTKTILVLGGTGKTGRRVAERLIRRGLPVRIGSRSGEPPFDWEDRATWALALCNMGTVYITYQPDLAMPGAVDAVRSTDYAALVMYLFTTVLDGRNAHLTDGVQRALGRAPRDFADYARDTAAAGVWSA
jgi:uncharacterized protein YbjT (DUF2867 family)